MLKRFSVENFASFKNEQSLDLTAGRTEVLPNHVIDFSSVKLLKSAVVYGANASGKSNLIKAMSFAKRVLHFGLENVDTHKKHFRLDVDSAEKPSSFDFEIELDGRFFCYGFSSILKTKEFYEEWFYEIGKKEPELIFSRDKSGIELGRSLKQKSVKNRFEIYLDDMKNQRSQLFLTEIAEKELDKPEVELINQVYNWFDEKLTIIYPDDILAGHSISSERYSEMLKKYLSEFDTGVVDIESIEEDFEIALKYLPGKMRERIAKDILRKEAKEVRMQLGSSVSSIYKDEEGELKVKKLGLVHGRDNREVFELKDESDGTKRLLDFIPLISEFDEDHTIVVDEFDRSLHPKLTRAFFDLFYQFHQSKAQLIVTTHESTLLDLELLRRDEIWFVEKGDGGCSALFSLNKFKIRYDSKVEKAYLLGRYGAVPVFGDFENID